MPPKNKAAARLDAVNGGGRRRWATVDETAEYLRLNVRTVRLMVADGRLTSYRLGPRVVRLDLTEVDAAMKPSGDTS